MSLPDEEARAIQYARKLLFEIATGWRPGETLNGYTKSEYKRIPRALREAARRVLRHYPLRQS